MIMRNRKITKAIVMVNGWGTRRLPITKAIEKCMLPVGNRPVVDYVVQDCIKAGIEDIFFVVNEESEQLQSYYASNEALEEYLRRNNKRELIDCIQPPINATFHYIIQTVSHRIKKYGTAVPVAIVSSCLEKDESVVVVSGDDFIYNKDGESEIKHLVDSVKDGESAMLGACVPKEQVSRYGVLEEKNNLFVRIVEKPKPADAPSNLINISKYVFNNQMINYINDYVSKPTESKEYYITDPINKYVKDGGKMRIVRAKGQYLDGGTLENWLLANQIVIGDLSNK